MSRLGEALRSFAPSAVPLTGLALTSLSAMWSMMLALYRRRALVRPPALDVDAGLHSPGKADGSSFWGGSRWETEDWVPRQVDRGQATRGCQAVAGPLRALCPPGSPIVIWGRMGGVEETGQAPTLVSASSLKFWIRSLPPRPQAPSEAEVAGVVTRPSTSFRSCLGGRRGHPRA